MPEASGSSDRSPSEPQGSKADPPPHQEIEDQPDPTEIVGEDSMVGLP